MSELASSERRTAILVANRLEAEAVVAVLAVEATRSMLGRPLWIGRLRELPVIVVETGISMVNAALAAQCALERFSIDALVVVGIAGAVRPDLTVGDVVVPARWGSYQDSHLVRHTADGWADTWRLMDFTSFGMMVPRPVFVARAGAATSARHTETTPSDETMRFWFESDPALVELARQSAEPARPAGDACVRLRVGGNAVSGAPFVDNLEFRGWLAECFRAEVVDQETAAIAQVAFINRVPYVALRAVSDQAGGDPGSNPIEANAARAAHHAALAAATLCAEIAGHRPGGR